MVFIGIDPWPCRGTPTSILVGNAMFSWNIWILLKFATLSCHSSGRSLFDVSVFPRYKTMPRGYSMRFSQNSQNSKDIGCQNAGPVISCDLDIDFLWLNPSTNPAGRSTQPSTHLLRNQGGLTFTILATAPACPVSRCLARFMRFGVLHFAPKKNLFS